VREDTRRRPTVLVRLGLEQRHAEHVVDVAMAVDRRVEPLVRPRPQRGVDARSEELAAGVDQNEAVVGGDCADVGERRHERDTVGDLLDFGAHDPQRVVVADVQLAAPQPVGHIEDGAHRVIMTPGKVRVVTGGDGL
jgi:hypothetical protein